MVGKRLGNAIFALAQPARGQEGFGAVLFDDKRPAAGAPKVTKERLRQGQKALDRLRDAQPIGALAGCSVLVVGGGRSPDLRDWMGLGAC